MKEKKVLLIGTVPPELGSKNSGGVAQVNWNLAKSYKEKGINFCIGAIGKYFTRYQVINGINIYGIGLSITAFLKTLKCFFLNINEIKYLSFPNIFRLLYALYFLSYINNKISYEIIHVHHVVNQIPLAAKLLGIKTRIIATIHSYHSLIMESEEEKKIQERKNINKQLEIVDCLTHVSNSVRKQGLSFGVKWECRDKIIYNGIDIGKHKELINYTNEQKKENYICFVGSLIPRKGINKLIRSYSLLQDEGLGLKIIGKGKLENELTQIPKNKIDFLGTLSNNQVLKYMSQSKVLVVPSISESFGLVYLEALSVGTPIVGYASVLQEFKRHLDLNNSLKDWMVEYDHNTQNEKDLCNKINEALSIKARSNYQQQRYKLRKKIFNKFSWKNIATNYQNLYQKYL